MGNWKIVNSLLATLQKINFAKTPGTVTRDGTGRGVKLANSRPSPVAVPETITESVSALVPL